MAVTVAELEVVIDGRIDKLKAELRKGETEVKTWSKKASDHVSQGLSFALGNFSVQGFIDGLKATARAMIQGNAQFETYKTSFEVLLGTMDRAEDRMRSLSKFAAVTPFELPEVVEANKTLEIMTNGLYSSEAAMTAIGDAASGVNQGFKDVAFWVGRAYSAIQGGQPFGEASMRLMEMGILAPKARNEVEQLAKAGADSSVVWAKFAESFDKFGDMMARQSANFSGLVSTLKDTISQRLRESGESLFVLLKRGLTPVIEFLSSDKGKVAVNVALALSAALLGLGVALAGYAAWSKAAGGAVEVLNAGLTAMAGPIGIAIALAGAMYYAYSRNIGGVKTLIDDLVKRFGKWAADVMPLIDMIGNRIGEVFHNADLFLTALLNTWGGNFGSFGEFVTGVFDFVIGGITAGLMILTGDWETALRSMGNSARAAMFRFGQTFGIGLANLVQKIEDFANAAKDVLASVLPALGIVVDIAPRVNLQDVKNRILGGSAVYGVMADTFQKAADVESKKRKSPGLFKPKSTKVPFGIGGTLGGTPSGGDSGSGGGLEPFDPVANDPALQAALALMDKYREAVARLKTAFAESVDPSAKVAKAAGLTLAEFKAMNPEARAHLETLVEMQSSWEYSQKLAEDYRQSIATANQTATDMILLARREVDLKKLSTETERMSYELTKGNLREVTGLRRGILMLIAQQKDAEAEAELAAARAMSQRARIAETMEKVMAAGDKLRTAWTDRNNAANASYAESIAEIDDRILRMTDSQAYAAEVTRRLALQFGVGYTEAERLADGLAKAEHYQTELAKADKLEAWADNLTNMANKVQNVFSDMFDDLFKNGFSSFFGNVMGGFRRMLADIAREYLASQIRGLLSGFITRAIGAAFGGGSGAGQIDAGFIGPVRPRAFGGLVSDGAPYMVGENGPELFVPGQSGRIIPNGQGGVGGVVVNITVNATDAASFMRSRDQIAAEAGLAIQRATRRNS